MKEVDAPIKIFLKDYQPPTHWITHTVLDFEIFEDRTDVHSVLTVEKNTNSAGSDLVLDGQDLELLSVSIDGHDLESGEYTVDANALTLKNLNGSHKIKISTRIYPHLNTSLEGLYKSRVMFCTQCEAEGFRKITYYLDRPDVMSEFHTKITADKTVFPVLLSNGNRTNEGDLEDGRHWAEWHDPFLKPCYLFALVAGRLAKRDDKFITMSGREVLIRLYVEEKDLDKCDHAITSLQNAMKWDEDVYGREYDLDIYMIVAVDDFNMGAMENKGLNIFNTSCVLANPKTTTDSEFQRVEGVVAHEYFHNWSGNRVTCRDWFQLSLKEGFTVFRDSEFSADMGSRTVKRVEDVGLLRSLQFSEDSGPLAHPVQPDSFIEISNFYTLTIYEKGAEIVRMIQTLLGPELFRQGSDLYFDRHDGQAVTIDDFVQAMVDVSGYDFTQFKRWYKQAGTPELTVSSDYNADSETLTVSFSQFCPPTPESETKEPFVIPVRLSLLGEAGKLPLTTEGIDLTEASDNTEVVLQVVNEQDTFTFSNVKESPVITLLRSFSAPVKLKFNQSDNDRLRIMCNDDDGFCRWDAAQQLVIQEIQKVMIALASDPSPAVNPALIQAYTTILRDSSLDPAMVSMMLSLPTEKYLADLIGQVDVDLIHHARNCVERKIAHALHAEFKLLFEHLNIQEEYKADSSSIAKRSLRNKCLHYLALGNSNDNYSILKRQFETADNMTDELAAFRAIVHSQKPSLQAYKKQAVQAFYAKWRHEPLVVNHWLSVQATEPCSDVLDTVLALMEHEAFDYKNPNKLRSLIGAFTNANIVNFHSASGKGYTFLADNILKLNEMNPQIASRLLTPFAKWKSYDETRKTLMKRELLRISAASNLSKDVFEVVNKTLGA